MAIFNIISGSPVRQVSKTDIFIMEIPWGDIIHGLLLHSNLRTKKDR